MRALIIAAALALAGCSVLGSDSSSPPPAYVPPSAPSPQAQLKGVANAAKVEKLTGVLEISDLRPSDVGPGRWMICLRGWRDSKPTYFSVFFNDETYKDVRLSIIREQCELQSYRPTGPLPSLEDPKAAESPTKR